MRIVTTLGFALALSATTAVAGGMDEPMMEEPVMAPVVVEEESSDRGNWVFPLILLAIVAAAASS